MLIQLITSRCNLHKTRSVSFKNLKHPEGKTFENFHAKQTNAISESPFFQRRHVRARRRPETHVRTDAGARAGRAKREPAGGPCSPRSVHVSDREKTGTLRPLAPKLHAGGGGAQNTWRQARPTRAWQPPLPGTTPQRALAERARIPPAPPAASRDHPGGGTMPTGFLSSHRAA